MTNGKWVDVKDNLPIEDMHCLVFCKGWGISLHPFNKYHNCWDDEDGDDFFTDASDGKVTHWMALPAPPVKNVTFYCDNCGVADEIEVGVDVEITCNLMMCDACSIDDRDRG